MKRLDIFHQGDFEGIGISSVISNRANSIFNRWIEVNKIDISHLIPSKIDSIFITFDGFTLSEQINYSGQLYWNIPKRKPIEMSTKNDHLEASTPNNDVMRFLVDRHKSTETLIVFRQIE